MTYQERVEEFLRAAESERLTLAQAERAAGIKRASLFLWLKRGLPSVSIGGQRRCGRRYVLKRWLAEFIGGNQPAPTDAKEESTTTGGSAAGAS